MHEWRNATAHGAEKDGSPIKELQLHKGRGEHEHINDAVEQEVKIPHLRLAMKAIPNAHDKGGGNHKDDAQKVEFDHQVVHLFAVGRKQVIDGREAAQQAARANVQAENQAVLAQLVHIVVNLRQQVHKQESRHKMRPHIDSLVMKRE